MKKFLIAISVLMISLDGYSQQLKVFLQGAYSSSLLRHRDNTTAWANAMNLGTGGNALIQPYWVAPFNYGTNAGPEFVGAGFFMASPATTDIVDWVLLELRDKTFPSIVIARKAAFIREDGVVVEYNTLLPVSFPGVPPDNYHLTIRHRNHLSIRTLATFALNAGNSFIVDYNFTNLQTKAYQNLAITTNMAQKDFGGGIFGMWAGNSNGMTAPPPPLLTFFAYRRVRMGWPPKYSDYYFLIYTTLIGNVTTILTNRYHPADMNMDGTVRASGPSSINDYVFLVSSVLGGNVTQIRKEHF